MSMSSSSTALEQAKTTLKEMQARKDAMEKELEQLHQQNIRGNLVDDEGFPRSDVDVHGIRIIRNKIAMLHNDHKQLMKDISSALETYHGLLKKAPTQPSFNSNPTNDNKNKNDFDSAHPISTSLDAPLSSSSSSSSSVPTPSSSSSTSSNSRSNSSVAPVRAFYRVERVLADSPASVAGLRVNDRVVAFGSVNHENVSKSAMAALVQQSVGRALTVVVQREVPVARADDHSNDEEGRITIANEQVRTLTLSLTPQTWSGQGLLGCLLVDI